MQVQIHETLVHIGYATGPEVQSALYWSSRMVENLKGITRYAAMRRKLQEIIWDHFRVLGERDFAVDKHGAAKLDAWSKANLHRLTSKQMADGRQFADHVEALRQFVDAQK